MLMMFATPRSHSDRSKLRSITRCDAFRFRDVLDSGCAKAIDSIRRIHEEAQQETSLRRILLAIEDEWRSMLTLNFTTHEETGP